MTAVSFGRIVADGHCSMEVSAYAYVAHCDHASILFSGPKPTRGHKVMPDVPAPAKRVGDARLSVGDGIRAGLRVAIIGSAGVALVECLARIWVLHNHFQAGAWPWGLIVATYGKFSITHLMLWCCIPYTAKRR